MRFPKDIMKELKLSVGDKLKLVVENGRIILEPVRSEREQYDIKHLVKSMPEAYTPSETFDDSVGLEQW